MYVKTFFLLIIIITTIIINKTTIINYLHNDNFFITYKKLLYLKQCCRNTITNIKCTARNIDTIIMIW